MAQRTARPTAADLVRVLIGLGLLAVGLVVALPAVPDGLVVPVCDLAEVAFAAVAGAACWWASRSCAGRTRRAWSWTAGAAASWAAGQAYWATCELLLHHATPFPSPADAGFLGMPLAGAVGLWLLAERPGSGRRRLLDGLLVSAGLALVSWQTSLGAVFRAGGESRLAIVVSLAYPAGDVVLLTMAVLALAQGGRQRSAMSLLAGGLLAFAVADSAFALATAQGDYATGSLVDVGWCAGFGLVALAALAARGRPRPAALPPTVVHLVSGMTMLPYVPVLTGVVVIVVRHLSGHELDSPSLGLTVLLVAVVLLRQDATVRDNQRLASAVAEREGELRHQAFHDALTGLANRGLFTDRLTHALELRQHDRQPLAVVFLDLDGFKGVNDTLGHAAGDELLVRASERLRGTVRAADTVARLGGDEFAVLLERCAAPSAVARQLVEAFRMPFALTGRAVVLSASVGVAELPGQLPTGEPVPDADTLLRRADTAMYAVKRAGKNDFRLHSPDLRVAEGDDLSLHGDLAAALQDRRVTATYQPIVDVATGAVRGYEALARWQRDGVPVTPDVFIPVAERGGLVLALTDLMLDLALLALAGQPEHIYVAVNVSRYELAHSGLPGRVAVLLARHGVAATRLVVEVTESGLADDPVAARATLTGLRDLGIRIALDDFGTGYNALAQLLQMPLDVVKIDRLFVRDVDTNVMRQQLLEGLVVIAGRLSLDVVAEGVETPEELRHLRRLGVQLAQGYLLGRPGLLPCSGADQSEDGGVPALDLFARPAG